MLDFSTVPSGRVLARTGTHIYLRPHPALADVVAHYTIHHPPAQAPQIAGPPLTLLPDISGCLVYYVQDAQRGRFWGATTRAVTVQQNYDVVPQRFFVEFLPGGAHAATGLWMAEWTDRTVPVAEVAPLLHQRLAEALLAGGDVAELLREADAALLAACTGVRGASLLPALARLCTRGAGTVRALADETGYSERHLGRLFGAELGVPVKACSRVLRVNRAAAHIVPGASLTEVAHRCGYYDQSHFIHDFKAVCGVSPGQYQARMSDFYREEFKF